MKTKTKTQIVEETLKFYSEDVTRRAEGKASCMYITDDGRECAVGRCLIDSTRLAGEVGGICTLYDRGALHWADFKPEYRIEDVVFWEELQRLHDHAGYWSQTGITELGLDCVENLLVKHAEPIPPAMVVGTPEYYDTRIDCAAIKMPDGRVWTGK